MLNCVLTWGMIVGPNFHTDTECAGLIYEDPRGPEAKIMNVIFKG